MMYLDLEELPTLFHGRWFWSYEKWNLACFQRRNHLGEQQTSLAESVRDLVEARTGTRPTGAIRLLTHLRYFGYLINPISLYYCFNETNAVEFIVAEVTNTPWGEMHCYVLDVREQPSYALQATTVKSLHVSPFMNMHYAYQFALTLPSSSLHVQITNQPLAESADSPTPAFAATLQLRRREITPYALARVLMRYPFLTMQVFIAIYWQALKLWWRGVPYVAHPKSKNPATTEPHVSRIPL